MVAVEQCPLCAMQRGQKRTSICQTSTSLRSQFTPKKFKSKAVKANRLLHFMSPCHSVCTQWTLHCQSVSRALTPHRQSHLRAQMHRVAALNSESERLIWKSGHLTRKFLRGTKIQQYPNRNSFICPPMRI